MPGEGLHVAAPQSPLQEWLRAGLSPPGVFGVWDGGVMLPNPAPNLPELGFSRQTLLGVASVQLRGVLTHPKREVWGTPLPRDTALSPSVPKHSLEQPHQEVTAAAPGPLQLPNCTSAAKPAGNYARGGEDAPSAPQIPEILS